MRALIIATIAYTIGTAPAAAQWSNNTPSWMQPQPLVRPIQPPQIAPMPYPSYQPAPSWTGVEIGNSQVWTGSNGQTMRCTTIGIFTRCN